MAAAIVAATAIVSVAIPAICWLIVVRPRRPRGGSSLHLWHHPRGQAARGAGGAHHDDDEKVGEHALAGAGNGGKSRGSEKANNNQPKSGMKDFQYNTCSK